MIIADTSALVLNWTSRNVWTSKNAQNYFDSLDLSAADTLYKRFNKDMHSIQCQMLSNRKYFMRNAALAFLEQCKTEHTNGQVIILAAGIDPLSVELASLFPESLVFDVDKFSLKEKETQLTQTCPNIKFVECDISQIELLEATLVDKGWNKKQPAFLVMEGITYYLTEHELKNVLTFFAKQLSGMACDFGLSPASVHEASRKIGIEIVRKITESVNLTFMNCYEPGYFMDLVRQCGFKDAERFSMAVVQTERTGGPMPFQGDEPAWVGLVKTESSVAV
jgi:O-methyltransferase involved in polyketide biosynthesis